MPAGCWTRSSSRRRAATGVLVAITLPVLVGFAALVIDVGNLYITRAELQVAADAAAIAGASAYFTDVGLSQYEDEVTGLVSSFAQNVSLQNLTLRQRTILEGADIALGAHDFDDPTAPLVSDERWNAVQVVVRRTPESENGSVPFYFASIFGRLEGSVTASARAAMNDRFAGYNIAEEGGLVPFTVHEETYEDMVVNGPDDYLYDVGIEELSDGIPEARLFPSVDDDPDDDIPGNFGTLNIGLESQGTPFLSGQIQDGIEPSDLQSEFGTTELLFYDADGDALTYTAAGNPGMSLGVRPAVESRIGEVIGFFVHQTASGQGANAIYVISGIRFGRVMAVHLTGPPSQRRIVIQPVAYTDGNIIVNTSAPSTNGQMGKVVLVQ